MAACKLILDIFLYYSQNIITSNYSEQIRFSYVFLPEDQICRRDRFQLLNTVIYNNCSGNLQSKGENNP